MTITIQQHTVLNIQIHTHMISREFLDVVVIKQEEIKRRVGQEVLTTKQPPLLGTGAAGGYPLGYPFGNITLPQLYHQGQQWVKVSWVDEDSTAGPYVLMLTHDSCQPKTFTNVAPSFQPQLFFPASAIPKPKSNLVTLLHSTLHTGDCKWSR